MSVRATQALRRCTRRYCSPCEQFHPGTATFDRTDAGPRVTRIALTTRGDVPGIDGAAFREAAEGAKSNCPVSKALEGNVEITLDAALA